METRRLITESLSLNGFEYIDFLIWLAYVILVISVSIFMCKSKEAKNRTVCEYYMANHTLPWWAVATTIIAVNISAEQFIGMAGTCYKYGIAVAAYEIMSALVLVVVAKLYSPVYWGKHCYTMPQILRLRYNTAIGTAFSIIWILSYVFITLTSVSWLGSIAIEHMLGLQGCDVAVFGMEISIRTVIVVILLCVSGFCSIWGGQNAIAWTDVLHFIFIFVGGLITAYFAICAVGGEDGTLISGVNKLYSFFHTYGHTQDLHIHLIIRKSVDPEGYSQMPGLGMIVGGLWIMNMCYWGFNQIILQKGASAENSTESRKGLLFAAYIKLFMPIIILVPGLCAYYMMQTDNGMQVYGSMVQSSNDTMAWTIAHIMPTGIKGLFFATLTAAVISTLSSVSNSVSALFTLDIYRKFIAKKANDEQTVKIGRWTTVAALFISAISMHPLINRMDDGYAFIQEMSSYIYPALMTLMTIGLFWKKATSKAAVTVVIATFPLGILIKRLYPGIPFLDAVGYVYMLDVLILIIVSLTNRHTRPSNLSMSLRKKIITKGCTSAGLAIVCYMIATLTIIASHFLPSTATSDNNIFAYLTDIGVNSFFIGGTVFLASAISNLSNGYSHTESLTALEFEAEGFSTTKHFTTRSFILLALVIIIYTCFW